MLGMRYIYWLFGAEDQKVMQGETAEMKCASLKTIKRLIHRFNEVGVAGEFWLFRKHGRKRGVAYKVGGLEP
jgi:transposase